MHERLLNYVEKIAGILAKTAKFGIYDEDDIHQEIFLLVYKAEPMYDAEKGDEFSFYYHFVKNRLLTLRRNKYANNVLSGYDGQLKLNSAGEISEEDKLCENKDIDYVDRSDLLSTIVDSKIPAAMRINYLKLLEGVSIDWHDKGRLIGAIQNIVRANNDKEK